MGVEVFHWSAGAQIPGEVRFPQQRSSRCAHPVRDHGLQIAHTDACGDLAPVLAPIKPPHDQAGYARGRNRPSLLRTTCCRGRWCTVVTREGLPPETGSAGPALRIAVVCVCGCVSGTILKCGLEGVIRELGLQHVIVEVQDVGHLREDAYDALFCMTALASRIETPSVLGRVYGVANAFDRQELRMLLRSAVAKIAASVQQKPAPPGA